MITIKISDEKYSLPESWDDVKLGQFQAVNKIEYDKEKPFDYYINLINIFTGIPYETILQINKTQFIQMVNVLSFTVKVEVNGDYTKEFSIGTDTYKLKDFTKLTMGEFISLEMLINDGLWVNVHKMLVVLFKKNDEDFNTDKIEEYSKVFQDELSITTLIKVVTFFLLIEERYTKLTHLYLAKKKLKLKRGNPTGLMALWHWIADGIGLAWWRGWQMGTSYVSKKLTTKDS